eukprot:scaffold8629_cov114-Isochrysis_galbana.AAC.4
MSLINLTELFKRGRAAPMSLRTVGTPSSGGEIRGRTFGVGGAKSAVPHLGPDYPARAFCPAGSLFVGEVPRSSGGEEDVGWHQPRGRLARTPHPSSPRGCPRHCLLRPAAELVFVPTQPPPCPLQACGHTRPARSSRLSLLPSLEPVWHGPG